MAVSSFTVFYATEGRTYTTMLLLVALWTLALLSALDSGKRIWWVASRP